MRRRSRCAWARVGAARGKIDGDVAVARVRESVRRVDLLLAAVRVLTAGSSAGEVVEGCLRRGG